MFAPRVAVKAGVLACTVLGQAIAQEAPTAPFRIPFPIPTKLGNTQLSDSAYVGDAMSYKYEGQGISSFDIYVWPLPAETLDSATQDTLLQREIAKFKEAVPIGIERGWYDDYKIAFDAPHPVALKAGSLPGYVVAFAFVRGNERYTSFFYIYAVKGMYLKIRLTVPADDWGSNPALDLPATLVRGVAGRS